MDIKLLTESCAKITVDAEECRDMKISYESFSPDSMSARLFLASLLARLEVLGVITDRSDKMTAEIFEQSDGSLVIYIFGKGISPLKKESGSKYCENAIICKDPQETIATARTIPHGAECSLYKYNGNYVLFTHKEPYDKSCLSDIAAAKIKEYGKLLSDTPLSKLLDI